MLHIGAPVPRVAVTEGDSRRPLADLVDRPTLLIFVKEDCATTGMALPLYAGFRRYEPAVRVLAVSQDDRATTEDAFAALGVDVPFVVDEPPYEASAAFDLPGVPSLYLVEGGEVRWAGSGWYRNAAAELDALLAQRAGVEAAGVAADDLPILRPG